jgi:hypothetical protein
VRDEVAEQLRLVALEQHAHADLGDLAVGRAAQQVHKLVDARLALALGQQQEALQDGRHVREAHRLDLLIDARSDGAQQLVVAGSNERRQRVLQRRLQELVRVLVQQVEHFLEKRRRRHHALHDLRADSRQ